MRRSFSQLHFGTNVPCYNITSKGQQRRTSTSSEACSPRGRNNPSCRCQTRLYAFLCVRRPSSPDEKILGSIPRNEVTGWAPVTSTARLAVSSNNSEHSWLGLKQWDKANTNPQHAISSSPRSRSSEVNDIMVSMHAAGDPPAKRHTVSLVR
jgi:hypothetical protein